MGQLLNYVHPQIYLSDPMKLKRKVLLDNKKQYEIIEGPKKSYKRFLERQNFCKIFLRGQDTKREGKNENLRLNIFK